MRVIKATIGGVEYRVHDTDFKDLLHSYAVGAFNSDTALLVYEDERYTYKDADLKATNLARSLQEEFGVQKGDPISIAWRYYPDPPFSKPLFSDCRTSDSARLSVR